MNSKQLTIIIIIQSIFKFVWFSVVQQPPGQTTIIYADQQPGYYRRGYDGSDAAMGIVAGAALGSMMWGPLLWW